MKLRKLSILLVFIGLLQTTWAGAAASEAFEKSEELVEIANANEYDITQLSNMDVTIRIGKKFSEQELNNGVFVKGVFGEKGSVDGFDVRSKHSWKRLGDFYNDAKASMMSFCTIKPLKSNSQVVSYEALRVCVNELPTDDISDRSDLAVNLIQCLDKDIPKYVYGEYRVVKSWNANTDKVKQFFMLAEKSDNNMALVSCKTPTVPKVVNEKLVMEPSALEILLNSFGDEVKFLMNAKSL